MSRSSDLALLIADRERQFGAMDDKQRRDFAVMYAKDRLPHQRKGGRFPADDKQPEPKHPNP